MSIFESLSVIDYVIFVLIILGGASGAYKGFFEELSQKFGLVVGFILGITFTKDLSRLVFEEINTSYWICACLSYCLLFIIGYLLVKLIGHILSSIFASSAASFVDSLLGFLIGVIEASVLFGAILLFLDYQNILDLSGFLNQSYFFTNLVKPLYQFFKSDNVKF